MWSLGLLRNTTRTRMHQISDLTFSFLLVSEAKSTEQVYRENPQSKPTEQAHRASPQRKQTRIKSPNQLYHHPTQRPLQCRTGQEKKGVPGSLLHYSITPSSALSELVIGYRLFSCFAEDPFCQLTDYASARNESSELVWRNSFALGGSFLVESIV